MNISINRKRTVQEAGDLISTKGNHLYAIIEDKGERFPYHLVCLKTFTIVESYDTLPTNKEIEEDTGEKINGIYDHTDSHISVS
ncbi:hypothetical protein [Halalkalibacter hemicellulosilyticus]|uniref:Uncharacterized protein n=1 Tax=Halalkalibacter hemicellulosilyticusJCM 9152 TaxID=1236971 RepID=W4QG88_9BACI|nr:hypothetical protein [Halalkalibacter hemicellulosilyticus]GAE31101.1 hypothetical protein JCM9152_2542 [Halalkalibacter hemicellulosilyticusJCM 9152]